MTRTEEYPFEAGFRALLDKAGIEHRRTGDGELVAPGKRGFLAAHDEGRSAWVLVYHGDRTPGAAYKNLAKQDQVLELDVEGDDEAVFLFAPEHLEHVARRWCRCRFRKRYSPETVARRRAVLARINAQRSEDHVVRPPGGPPLRLRPPARVQPTTLPEGVRS